MPRKRPENSSEYAVSDEAAAYIADALMELALQLRRPTLPKYAVTTNPSPPHVMMTPGNSTCSANTRRSDRWLLGSILWFDPRREHSSVPTAKSRSRRAQGLSRLAASSRPPARAWP